MKFSNSILLIALLLSVFALFTLNCSHNDRGLSYPEIDSLQEPHNVRDLIGHVLIGNDQVSFATDFQLIGQYVLIIDNKAEKLLQLFDVTSGDLVTSWGTRGQGPSEFISAWEIVTNPNSSDTFSIYDLSTRQVKKFSFSRVLSGKFSPDYIMQIDQTEVDSKAEPLGSDFKLCRTGSGCC